VKGDDGNVSQAMIAIADKCSGDDNYRPRGGGAQYQQSRDSGPSYANRASAQPLEDDWDHAEVQTNYLQSATSYKRDDYRPQQQSYGSGDRQPYSNDRSYGNDRSSSSYGSSSSYNRPYESNGGPRDYDRSSRGKSSYSNNNRISYRSHDDPPPPAQSSYAPASTEEESTYEPIDWDKANVECEAARKRRWESCPKMIKNFYVEVEEVTNMTEEEVEQFREQSKNITIARTFAKEEAEPEQMPKPVTKFHQAFGAYPDLMAEIQKQGFENPSPIQSQMWPVLLRGEDCIGIAQTGTGKTLAFLLPALIHTDGQPHPRGIEARGGPNVLVLAPTRELAIQIEKEVAKYQFRGIRAVCLYGGNDRKKQIEIVESGVEIIIATPGRLNDLVSAKHIKIESITYLILDEADR